MKNAVFILAVVASQLFTGCDKKNNPVIPPPPSMSGRWDVAFTGNGGTINGLMDLTEDNGALSGTITIAGSPLSVSGSVSQTFAVTLGGSDASGRMLVTANTNSSKNALTGFIQIWDRRTFPETYLGSLDLTGKKR